MAINVINKTEKELLLENEELRASLYEAEEALNAIRNGGVDAIVVSGSESEQIFSISSAETPYRIIIEEMNEGTVVLSSDGIILYCNRRFSELVSISPEQIVGSYFSDLIIEKEKTKFSSLLKAGLKGNTNGELTYFKEGADRPVYLQLLFSPLLFNQLGDVCIMITDISEHKLIEEELTTSRLAAMNLMEDAVEAKNSLEIINKELFVEITERKRAEQELIIAKERAEESDNLKTAFLQNMSHEIRTPLNGIIGFCRLLNSDNLSKEDIQEFTNMINISSERLIEIVNNVLDMSKIQTGQIKVVSEPIVINSLFSDLFDFFSNSAKEKNINLNYHSSGDINTTIYSDEGKLYQVLLNLINNSLKFTNSGSIDFGYDIIDNKIRFYVKDTGIGISEDMHDKIFDRFTQVEQTISRNYEGAGLGLAICKGLVEFLGGEGIWLESEINQGTTFYFTLPYKDEVEQSQKDELIF